jgi:hypothetical protein
VDGENLISEFFVVTQVVVVVAPLPVLFQPGMRGL